MIYYEYSEQLKDKDLLIHHHLGLGDHIVLNGLVNYISEIQKGNIFLLCKSQNFENIKRLYKNKKNIVVLNTKNIEEHTAAQLFLQGKDIAYLKIGHEKYNEKYEKENGWDCGQVFYHLAKIPYKYRFEKFELEYDEEKNKKVLKELNPENKPFIFVHDDPTRGFNVLLDKKDEYLVLRNNINYSLFDYIDVLKNAKEIHVMPSAFYCLIESLENIKSNLFCYNIRNVNFGLQKYVWNIK